MCFAHAAGIAWNVIVTPLIFRSLIAQGPANIAPAALAISIVVSVVVLLIFLYPSARRWRLAGPAALMSSNRPAPKFPRA